MSRKGENIYKRKDGRWEARYSSGFNPDGTIKYGYCYGRSYREVRDKAAEAKAAQLINTPKNNLNRKKRFSAFCDEWLQVCRCKVKPSTLAKYETNLERHIKPALGGFYAQSLSTVAVAEFGQELISEKKLSPKTVRDILTQLKAIIKYASEQIPALSSVSIVYPKEQKKDMRVLTKQEQSQLIEFLTADTDECKFGVMLAMMTGLRIGELCALRWGDISLESKTLTVSATMQRIKTSDSGKSPGKTAIVIGVPKSGTSTRVIPLMDSAVEMCRRWQRSDPEAFILTGSSKRFVEPRTLQYRLSRYAAECGLEDMHFHTLRHTFATRCVEVGFEIKSLSEILGHSSPRITLERYVHSSIELKRENMDKLTCVW